MPFRNAGLGCSVAVSLVLLGVVFTGVIGYIILVRDLPSLAALAANLDPVDGRIYQPTRLYDRTGEHEILRLENPAAAGWSYLTLDPSQENHIPSSLIKATLAQKEPAFWSANGFTLSGLSANDHPTIAQQLVFDLLLKKEPPGLRRNLRERLLAAQLIRQFGREQVLEWYLNTLQYSETVYGADAAGRVFFNKPASQLNVAEAAFLVTMAGHTQANPWSLPPDVLDQQREIIQRMLGEGWITTSEAVAASQENLVLRPREPLDDLAPSFSRFVLEQLGREFPHEDLARGGWKITTSLDFELQRQAACTVAVQLSKFVDREATAADFDLADCEAAKLLPTLSSDLLAAADDLGAAVLVIDPNRGQVLAMVGDSVTPRQAGTILTPFIYFSAFTRGFTPATLVWDIPGPNQNAAGLNNQEYQGPLRLRTALVNDYLQPVLSISHQLGSDVIQVTAQQMGIDAFQALTTGQIDQDLLHANASLLEITRAFGIFANEGLLVGQTSTASGSGNESQKLISPSGVLWLQDADDVIWLDGTSGSRQPVISPQLAYLMNHILSDEPVRWSSLGHPNALEVGRPAGAKTGLSVSGLNSWTVGYTPQVAVGVWVGKSGLTTNRIPPAISAGIWHALVQHTVKDKPPLDWTPPPGITFMEVCDPSGLIPTPDCPKIVTEVFLPGTEPSQLDYLYRVFHVNRETGRLATVFTPPELIEQKVYLMPPLEAKAWALEAGLPTPPDAYDVIYTAPASDNAAISDPAMFAHVSGVLDFTGTASGSNFDYYRLQVGQGLNPQTWIQIGDDATQPVENGTLGTWDTRQLSGLYAVQLLVVSHDQRVDRTVMQVTVDNQPPEINIVSPQPNQEIDRQADVALAIHAEVSDNLEIARVVFFIDKQEIATLHKPPYLVSWQASPGDHTLQVQVLDLAGNERETAVQFVVK